MSWLVRTDVLAYLEFQRSRAWHSADAEDRDERNGRMIYHDRFLLLFILTCVPYCSCTNCILLWWWGGTRLSLMDIDDSWWYSMITTDIWRVWMIAKTSIEDCLIVHVWWLTMLLLTCEIQCCWWCQRIYQSAQQVSIFRISRWPMTIHWTFRYYLQPLPFILFMG